MHKIELVQEKILSEIQSLLNYNDNISIEQNLFVLGLDSLKSIELIVNLEEAFNIEFDDEELSSNLVENVDALSKRVFEKIME
ncbi:acyl carrier protein [Bacillus cereus]|uniref:acyl carrier protein n=1 Tax=Bacillus cereus TaxID=1396 RepID=UPI00065B97C3|nr:phosphopantetheine-binding protein [Bacillus cereus]KMQ32191.1 hypothetical protein TU58_01515 [Bacillus cereus]